MVSFVKSFFVLAAFIVSALVGCIVWVYVSHEAAVFAVLLVGGILLHAKHQFITIIGLLLMAMCPILISLGHTTWSESLARWAFLSLCIAVVLLLTRDTRIHTYISSIRQQVARYFGE